MRSLRFRYHKSLHALLTATLVLSPLAGAVRPSAQQQPVQTQFTETTSVNIVSVDVVVRDSKGDIVKGLTAKDFIVSEDGRRQTVETFSFQEAATTLAEGTESVNLLDGIQDKLLEERRRAASANAPTPAPAAADPAADAVDPMQLLNRRMIVMLFDTSSMQPEHVQNAIDSAVEYVEEQMAVSDLVAIVTIGTDLEVITDFTSDVDTLLASLRALGNSYGTEVDVSALVAGIQTAATEEAAASGDAAATEAAAFEQFNNDIRLRALKTMCQELSPIQQKKAVLYFSAGMQRSGDDNQIELRSATTTCNRGNVSIYPVDARGLQAVVAGGGASSRSGGGVGLFNGSSARGFQQLSQTQGTLTTLAADTGGRAFTDTNDFSGAFDRVQNDLAAYYLLGYSSTNPARDGKFRRIEVRINRPDLKGLKVDARPGYYAGRSFENTNRRDREALLDDQLAAAVSSTDVPMVVGTGYFRQTSDRFYVPIALAVPGFAVPIPAKAEKVTLDVKGEVRDEQGRRIAPIRDIIEVPTAGATETLAGRQVYYTTGVSLPPGRFLVKIVVRENSGGAIGSFEAPVIVPQLRNDQMKVSSVIMSTQVQKTSNSKSDNPLVRDGVQLLPNLTRVVGRNQKVYFYYEVYDPALTEQAPDLRTSMAFYRGNVKVFETPMVERVAIDEQNRKAVVFQFEVPAEQFKPGTYTLQINIIDAVASTVSFPRMQFAVMN